MERRRRSGPPTLFRKRRRRRLLPLLLAIALAGGGTWAFVALRDNKDPEVIARTRELPPCEIPRAILQRVSNGYFPKRSGDVLAVERMPNQFGTRHSTPYAYTQNVPIVLYGPGFIRQNTVVDRPVTVADLAPTLAELLGFDEFPERDGRVLEEALLPADKRNGTPRLIVTIVWDGGGDNVLERWPEHWPELKRFMAAGTAYENGTVGSSPSITPAVHATIATGAFPKHHGVVDIKMRRGNKIVDAVEGANPKNLKLRTLSDLWDAAVGNASLIGMMARDAWHLMMIGHGAYLPEGDHDIAVMDELGGIEFRTNKDFYSLPAYMKGTAGLERAVAKFDKSDGAADRQWRGNPLLAFDAKIRYTPAWPRYQTQRIIQLLKREGFGKDEVADLFYTNYKGADLAGHEWNMIEPEVRDVIAAQDAELPVLIDALDDLVGPNNYVIALTADHGMAPSVEAGGGWSINQRELTDDMLAEFDTTTNKRPLILSNRSYQMMLDRKEAKRAGVTAEDIAEFVRNYRLADNATGEVPKEFADRKDELLYLMAMTPSQLKEALNCAEPDPTASP